MPAEAKSRGSRPSRPRKDERGERDPLESHAQRFFAEGEAMSEGDERRTLHSGAHESDASSLGSIAPHPQRRGALMRYVVLAVAVSVLLGLVALAQISLAHSHPVEPSVVATTAAPAVVTAPEPVASATPPPVPVPTAAAAPPADVPVPQPSAVPDVPSKTAAEEKTDARRSLEHGKLNDAILSALRSTALDSTDADAWLLLGAAYQASGKAADARASYATCAKEAKKGEVRECQLMLR